MPQALPSATPSASSVLDPLPPGSPIDLDNCEREPIQFAGAVQPRGVLLVVSDPDLHVLQVSENIADILGVTPEACVDRPLAAAVGARAEAEIRHAVSVLGDLRDRNPLELSLDLQDGEQLFDVILHRSDRGLLLVELESAQGPRPLSFTNTYLAVRSAVEALNRTASLPELFQITADSVRALTGFDRVMVYRYDRDYNGEVVAEAKRDDLNTFLGLHYPASDIPAQARALYEKNWLRLISDVDYTPVPITPVHNPLTGDHLDLTYASLRSVSPIHLEYLRNMGVGASMSISLLQEGRLWGLIACHHYSGSHAPPYGVRAAAEFLGSTLSVRLLNQQDEEFVAERLRAQSVLSRVVAASRDDSRPLVDSLVDGPDPRELIDAPSVVLDIAGRRHTYGPLPSDAVLRALTDWARGTGEEVVCTERVSDVLDPAPDPDLLSGALVVLLPDGGSLAWLRPEKRSAVDWGGDPHNKAIAVQEENGDVRLSPRKSFERWTEVVRLRSAPWTESEVQLAHELRRHLVESLYARSRYDVALAQSVQRHLLPELPELTGWTVSAHYEPAAGGRIGGDWYDAFPVPGGRLALVLGDVAGHGVPAAGAMAQLRNVLRGFLYAGASPARAVTVLNEYVLDLSPGLFATIFVAIIDEATGAGTAVSAGHPQPFVVGRSANGAISDLGSQVSPPLGIPGTRFVASDFSVAPGECLVLYSDGLIERKGEDIDAGIARIASILERLEHGCDADAIFEQAGSDGRDDVTVLTATRAAAD